MYSLGEMVILAHTLLVRTDAQVSWRHGDAVRKGKDGQSRRVAMAPRLLLCPDPGGAALIHS